MAGIIPPFTVSDAIYDCGVMESALFNGDTKSDRISAELSDDDFSSCLYKTYK